MRRNEIEKIMLKAGIPIRLKGFRYIADVMELYDNGWYDSTITFVYLKVAKERNVTEGSVERAIRSALSITREHPCIHTEKYLGTVTGNTSALKHLYCMIPCEADRRAV